jgi:hypothetical protein
MLNFDPRKPFYRILFFLLGSTVIGLSLTTFRNHDLFYENWWGGLVFAPIAIVFGLVIIFGAIFKPSIFGKHPATRN